MNDLRKETLINFQRKLNIETVDIELLNFALSHKSFANEIWKDRQENIPVNEYNERLEFLGDAILGMVIVHSLYQLHPTLKEGVLTAKKARAVCEATLVEVGCKICLGDVLLLGKGERATGGATRDSNIANALEALIAAIFLSAGYKVAEEFILFHWGPYLKEKKVSEGSVDYKSQVQNLLVKERSVLPEYRVVQTSGPEHARIYEISLHIHGQKIVTGHGSSKKKAEQDAAHDYLKQEKKLKT